MASLSLRFSKLVHCSIVNYHAGGGLDGEGSSIREAFLKQAEETGRATWTAWKSL